MPSRILLSLSLLFLTWSGARAQTADDFFHGGAQHYLSNNVPSALQTVTNGLQRFPDDAKLKKLYELLNQQQQQNQQNQKDQKQDQSKDDQQKDKEQKQKEAQDKKGQDKKDPQQAKASDKAKGKPDEKKETGEPQPIAAHAMTPQEAQQLLDAQKGDEQVLQFQPQGEAKNRTKQLKDW